MKSVQIFKKDDSSVSHQPIYMSFLVDSLVHHLTGKVLTLLHRTAISRIHAYPLDGQYNVCNVETIWIIALLGLYSVVSHVFPLAESFLTLSTLWKKKRTAENERGLPV